MYRNYSTVYTEVPFTAVSQNYMQSRIVLLSLQSGYTRSDALFISPPGLV